LRHKCRFHQIRRWCASSNRSAAQIAPQNKCGFCTNSTCCTYITQHIEAPRSKYDFEHLLWQVSHETIEAYNDEDAGVYWSRRTAAILSGTRCGIYADRPQICRGHSNDYCEFDAPAEDGFDLYFPNYQVLLKYCKKRFKRWECR
jgi:uncharacterized protein